MKVYLVRWDGDDRIVEAASFGEAIKAWRTAKIVEWLENNEYKAEEDDQREPDSVQEISDEPVIR